MSDTYRFIFADNNVYGHIVSLIKSYAPNEGIHVDLGCGFGAIAEPIKELGLTYVGFDFDDSGPKDLRARGFQAEHIDLSNLELALNEIVKLAPKKQLASISIIDTLEHITNGQALLDALRSYVDSAAIPLFVSVPNVTHRDIGAKLLAGRWDYTEVGLLDHTHVIHHTDKLITAMTLRAGWIEIANNDVYMEVSDQCFPEEHILLSPQTNAGNYLRFLRKTADSLGTVNQMVRAYLPGPAKNISTISTCTKEERPFLTVITCTQGRRIDSLRDVFLCLAAQTCQDFELLVIGHKMADFQRIEVEKLIEDLPDFIYNRVRLILVDHGGRATSLNFGFTEARGSYISILDEDNLVFAHWVETFKCLASSSESSVIRTVAVEQEVLPNKYENHTIGLCPCGPIQATFPDSYNLIDHLYVNQTPSMALSFPRSIFHDLNQKFDDELDTYTDWDFGIRAILLCGALSSPDITAIYLRCQGSKSLFTFSENNEKNIKRDRILSKLDEQYHVFPPGTVSQLGKRKDVNIQPLLHELELAKSWIGKLEPELYEARDYIKSLESQLHQIQNENWKLRNRFISLNIMIYLRRAGRRLRNLIRNK